MSVLVGSIHKHCRNGRCYVVESTPINVNTEELFVVYRCLGSAVGEQNFVRPMKEFQEKFTPSSPGRGIKAPRSFA